MSRYCILKAGNYYDRDAKVGTDVDVNIAPHMAQDGTVPDGMLNPRWTGVWDDASNSWVGGGWVDDEAQQLEIELYAQKLAQKLSDINSSMELELSTITSIYPASEIASWSKQEQEARAYIADNTASVPFITGMATARGITVADLANRIIAKADAYAFAAAAAIGKRQKLEDQVTAIDIRTKLPITNFGYLDLATAISMIEEVVCV